MENNRNSIDNFAEVITKKTISYRWLVILLSLIIAFSFGSQMKYLGFATDYRIFFSGENPDLTKFEKFQKTYAKNDNFIFVIKPSDGNAFSPNLAELQERVTKEAWQIPYATRVDSITNFQHTWSNGDNLTVEDLIKNGKSLTNEELQNKKNIALKEPILKNNLISSNGKTVGINVVLQYPGKDLKEVPTAAAKAREIVAGIKKDYPNVQVGLSGLSMMNNSFSEAGMKDAQTLIPIMY